MSLLDTASLIVTPNGYKEGKLYSVIPSDGSGDMSVVRATTATRVNSAGLVELVPYNLLTYSEQFDNADWIKGSSNNIVANAIISPYGTQNADKIQSIGGGTQVRYAIQTISNTIGTFSIYMKAGEITQAMMYVGASADGIYWNLTNGAFVSYYNTGSIISSYSSEDVGNGWFRYTITSSSFIASGEIYMSVNQNLGVNIANGEGFYIWGAQLVEGSTAKDYQKTETRLNIPRLDYSNGTCPSLLVEPQRTNLISPSNGSASNVFNGVFVANATTSPQGINNAFSFDVNNNSNGGVTTTTINTSAQPYTFSAYLKGSVNGQKVQLYGDLNGQIAIFTLTTEWVRYTATFTGAGFQSIYLLNGFYLSPAQNDLYYGYGMQLEAGSYATSYIPTTSASVTRNADVISKTGISSLIGQTEGTLFVDFYFTNTGGVQVILSIHNNADNKRIEIWANSSSIYGFVGGSSSFNMGLITGISGNRYKIAVAYKSGDSVYYVNGSQIANNSTSFTIDLANLIFDYWGGGYAPTANVNSTALWKTRLTNDQLATLTTL